MKDLFSYLGIPRTRQAAINLQWLGQPPSEWTIEMELDLPEDLQRLDLFEAVNGEYKLRSS